jgi:hypothetical protein
MLQSRQTPGLKKNSGPVTRVAAALTSSRVTGRPTSASRQVTPGRYFTFSFFLRFPRFFRFGFGCLQLTMDLSWVWS